MNPVVIFIVVAAALVAILVVSALRIIRPFEKGLVERLGKFQRTLDPGMHMIVPFFDTLRKVDMREVVIDVPAQLVITRDNVNVEVDGIIYLQVTDPVRSTYEIRSFYIAATKLAQTNLRNVIGEIDLDQCLASRDEINLQLRDVMDQATDKWGVKVNRIELQKIDPPEDITLAMSRQMRAERDKRAVILEAEGARQSQIARAEGAKQAQILEAEGFAEAVRKKADAEQYRQITVAEGEAKAILNVFNAIHEGRPDEKLVTLKYLEMLPNLAKGDANKIFMPYEASGILSALAAMVEGIRNGDDKAKSVPSQPVASEA
jgi:regulator of protease activity HflC (stomatin/prohibitin superfamily)